MKKQKRWISILMALVLAAALSACGGSSSTPAAKEAEEGTSAADTTTSEDLETEEPSDSSTTDTEEQEEGATHIVVDHTGREVELPVEINRIVISSILPLPSVYCLFEGSADKLVGIHPSSMAAAKNSILPVVVPDIVDVNTDFLTGDDLNIEELLNLKPDVVFYRAEDTAECEKLEAAGIPAIGFSTAKWDFDCIATFEGWVELLGEVLGQEDKAAGIVEYGREVEAEIAAKLEEAGDIEKPKVLILFNYANGVIVTSGSHHFGQYWIESTGGVNAAAELTGNPEINMEQIYEWDPDMIFITNFSPYLPEDLYNNSIEGNDWSNVRAVQEGHVYKFPLGMYRWFPPASDTPLVLKWLSTVIQPELFADTDMEQEVRDYYQRFYGVELTDEQVDQIFNPASEASGLTK